MVKPDIGGAFNLAWERTKRDWLTNFGILLVIGLLGACTFHVMTPALFGAYFVMMGESTRGGEISVGRVFDLARGHYLRMFGAAILLGLMLYGIFFAIFIPIGGLIAILAATRRDIGIDQDVLPCIFMALAMPAMLLFILLQIWLMTRWMFVFPIMVATGASFSDARAMSVRWVKTRGGVFYHFLFGFVSNLVAQIGQMLCLVGMVFTIPLAMCMKGALFQDHLEEERGGAMRPPFGGKPVR